MLDFRILNSAQRGVTFIELLVAIAIIGILAAIAVPYYGDYIERQRLVGAAEAVYGQLQQAKRAAVSNNRTVFFHAANLSASTDTWCATTTEASGGFSSYVDNSCSNSYVTVIANQSPVSRGVNYPGISLTASGGVSALGIGFSMPSVSVIDSTPLTLTSTRLPGTIVIEVSDGMQIEVCSDELLYYPDC